ncbi:MAG: heavy metal translocating P-type ATPase [Bacteroidales bacterium]|nr:heavy metal translocating P-type ATPase [Bacteroidales bacterium]
MSPRMRLTLILASAILLAVAVYIEHTCRLPLWQLLLVYLIPYLIVGWDTLKEAAEGLEHGSFCNEHFLMTIATLGALGIGFMPNGEPQFPEAVFVMLFFQIGELFEGYAEGRSRESISHLMDLRPDSANVEREGQLQSVGPEEVRVGEVILIRPGEKVPLDGEVIEGASALNTVALTGESVPREVSVGQEVLSGCVNLSGVLRVRVTKEYAESTVARIIGLIEQAGEKKSESESFIARFSALYTPVVVTVAVGLAFVMPLAEIIFRDFPLYFYADFLAKWVYRALVFLVVSCPCALVISVPLSFFAGIGGASRRGILIKGAGYMDKLAKLRTVVFDKTGTLTRGVFAVDVVHPNLQSPMSGHTLDAHELLHLAAHLERFSTHPIAQALREAYPDEAHDGCTVDQVKEVAGGGIIGRVNGREVVIGNRQFIADTIGSDNIRTECCQDKAGTLLHVVVDKTYAGHILISDQLKADSTQAIRELKQLGVGKTVMLTGDRPQVADHVARELHLDEWHADLLPQDKVTCVEELLKDGSPLAFVGDGMNDAPVLKRADVGVAMGALGSDSAIEAADVVLMDDEPRKVALAVCIARRTIGIARQNIAFAIGVKVLVLLLAALGLANMWLAVFADVGVTVLAVLNAMRALHTTRT